LLSDHIINISHDSDRKDCTVRWSDTNRSPCRARYYIPGGIESSIPALLNNSDFANSDVFLAQEQQGYVFEFEDGDPQWQYNATSECSAYGLDQTAFALCLKNGGTNEILARK
jgi:hypothetical protein